MNFKILILTAALCLLVISAASAQDSRSEKKKQKDKQKQEQQYQQHTNTYRYVPEEEKPEITSKRKRRKNRKSFARAYNKHLNDLVEEFYDRLEANAKRDKKIRRKMDHPKYSDFSYFGHKRKPKIRPVGKRKFCEECGIVH